MKVEIAYFKRSGKWYTSAQFAYGGEWYNISERLAEMNADGTLPGLASGEWDGLAYVNSKDAYPKIIDFTGEIL